MRTFCSTIAATLVLFASGTVSAQGIQISRENRTIAVSANATAIADPEIAMISLGYQNYGKTRDAAYDDNTQTASRIVSALLAAGLKEENIETSDIRVGLVDSSEQRDFTAAERKDKQFEAGQTWTLRVPPEQAQIAVDRAVAAGAEVKGVWWVVADPDARDAKAEASALSKARAIADEMAKPFGGKVGELLFVSNAEPGTMPWVSAAGNVQRSVTVESTVVPSLKLFPQKIRRDVTVYAVFALE
jgi:uncharacterized protein